MSILIDKARAFAIAAHSAVGQRRKYTGEPYWKHPADVVRLLRTVTDDQQILAAAWLHDVVEDTQVDLSLICRMFGSRVAELVEMVTDVSKPEDGYRAARKAIDREHIAKAHPDAKTIKLADLIDNSKSILDRDPNFAKVYMKEKAALLAVLTEGDERLWNIAHGIVSAGLPKED